MALIGVAALGGVRGDSAHREGPPPAHTGGLGEPTCQACHAEYDLNLEGGSLSIEGLPEAWMPGERYPLRLVLQADGTVAAGFQLAIRTPDGRQAGAFAIPDRSRMAVDTVEGPAGEVHYLRHTWEGAEGEGSGAEWRFDWIAPTRTGSVVLHAAGNSANGDNSPFGDLVYTVEARVPAQGVETMGTARPPVGTRAR